MTAYFVITYDITDPLKYAQYNPGSNHITGSTVAKHGGEIIVASNDVLRLHGAETAMKVIIQFPSREAAQAWDNDADYAKAKAIRLASTKNINAFIVDKL
ncbi:DUF1330 domain-containing protein [Psychromonas arctica]|uniref:DUF1330 domain-containing protein n=1 Tax=Psychromonas arctica TaxID=168275 RepID=UPI0004022EE4|nr:DUF1330 domain-containing protein [Psychromonas arctica]